MNGEKQRRTSIQIRIEESLRDEFYEIAQSKAQTPSQLIRLWINEYIKENKKE